MKKTLINITLLVLVLTLILCSCSPAPQAEQSKATIIALAPSLNETIIDLGLGDHIIGYDLESEGLDGLDPNAEKFDIISPDLERIAALAPDYLFTSGLSLYDADDPYKPISDAGAAVVVIPTAQSIEGVSQYILKISEVLGVPEKGKELTYKLAAELKEISDTAAKIPESERKSVYFEIAAAPEMYSTGSGTYLNEMIELIGAKNILSGQEGWMPVNAEAVAAADPDVILTNVNYLDDPTDEIKSRAGWQDIAAVKNGKVYQIDNRASSLPNENIIKAIKEMAQAVYPEYYE